jgi:hypothetical protein
MMQVNPATAYNMLSRFVDLLPGDSVVQNGANSTVQLYMIGNDRLNRSRWGKLLLRWPSYEE